MFAVLFVVLLLVIGIGLMLFGYLIEYHEDSLHDWVERKLNPKNKDDEFKKK